MHDDHGELKEFSMNSNSSTHLGKDVSCDVFQQASIEKARLSNATKIQDVISDDGGRTACQLGMRMYDVGPTNDTDREVTVSSFHIV
jgi:hypothetical protein